MALIYHVTSGQSWSRALETGFYEHPSLAAEGFIHCAEKSQVQGVLERYFSGQPDLLLLTIDTARLKSRLQYDLAPSVQEEFPHIYGPLNTDAVLKADPV